MSQLQRCKDLLADLTKQIVAVEQNINGTGNTLRTPPSNVQPAVASTAGPSTLPVATVSEHQRVFGYMPRSAQSQRQAKKRNGQTKRQPPTKKGKQSRTWTRTFVCLSSTSNDRMPSAKEYRCLRKASLGEKKLTFYIDDSSVEFDGKVKKEFPKLEAAAGGYEIMYSQNPTRNLIAIKPPYTVTKLKAETGQGKLFIRPMQRDLDITPDVCESDEEVNLNNNIINNFYIFKVKLY